MKGSSLSASIALSLSCLHATPAYDINSILGSVPIKTNTPKQKFKQNRRKELNASRKKRNKQF